MIRQTLFDVGFVVGLAITVGIVLTIGGVALLILGGRVGER